MSDTPTGVLDNRLARVERRLHFLEIAVLVLTAGLTVAIWMGRRPLPAHAADSSKILRARGLIIEDVSGRPRILLGAPVPKVKGRKRSDEATGLIVLGEGGADRVAVASPTPDPQIQGKVSKRIGSDSGLVIDDNEGNERGGIGVLDNDGRGVACLDYASGKGGEAVCMAVVPEEGASFRISDPSGNRTATFVTRANSLPKLLFGSVSGNSKLDVRVLRLNSDTVHQLTFDLKKTDEKAISEELDKLGP